MKNLEELPISEVEKILNAYYAATSKSEMLSNGILTKDDRHFTDVEIGEIISAAGYTDPYEVPFRYIVDKYYEPEYISEAMEHIQMDLSMIVKAMLIEKCCRNISNIKLIKSSIKHNCISVYNLMKTYAGLNKLQEYYSSNKETIYNTAIQFLIDDIALKETVDASMDINMLKYYPECVLTDKIPYPISDNFDLDNILKVINMVLFDTENTVRIVDGKLSIKKITIEEALSNIPKETADDMINTAKRYVEYSIRYMES